MIRSALGDKSLQVSRLGLGTVQLGMAYGYDKQPPPPEDEAIRIIRQALDMGINFIDTAPAYGHSEYLVGKACTDLAERPVIATKISIRDPGSGCFLCGQALRDSIEHSLSSSLRQLKLDALDLVQIHSLATRFITSELLNILADYRNRGLVRFWGATTYGEEAPLDALEYPEYFTSVQIPYNLLDRQMESRVLPRAEAQSIGVVFRSVFLQGVLSHRLGRLPKHLIDLQELAAPVARLADVAGIGLGELALRFAAFSPWVNSTIFGTTNIDELADNIRAIQLGPLPLELTEALYSTEIADRTMLNPGNWQS